jgi:hypothetical protein
LGGIEVLVAAFKNHMNFPDVWLLICERACCAVEHNIEGSKENTLLFMNAGGVAALTKAREEFLDIDIVQPVLGRLAKLVAVELATWADSE